MPSTSRTWRSLASAVIAKFTGFSTSSGAPVWAWSEFKQGGGVLALAAVGHMLANKFGLNARINRAIPYFNL